MPASLPKAYKHQVKKIECFKYVKTVNCLTHKNIWSQHSLEHPLYFHVWATIFIHFVFLGFAGGSFLVFWLTIYVEGDHVKLTWTNQCTIPPLQDFCSLSDFFTLETERITFLNIYQNVSRILVSSFWCVVCIFAICVLR